MRGAITLALSTLLCLFTLSEVNYPLLRPQSQLAIFAALGITLSLLSRPLHPSLADHRLSRALDWLLSAATVAIGGFLVSQTEPAFRGLWIGGAALGDRAGVETPVDTVVGVAGLLIVLEATRRSIGWALPLLALIFVGYAYFGAGLPDWAFPHRGYPVERIVAQTFLHSQGVFGVALRVMFVYVFLFVLFGAVLKATGATGFILDFAQRVLGHTPGGPAKVAVLASGLMGSLSGSAVANTATTGTFTIPLMKRAGFTPEVAGGIEAAASSGGALMPPVMGAGAYLMLEIIDPPVSYLEIVRAALIPALLFYVSLLLIVHFQAKRIGAGRMAQNVEVNSHGRFAGVVFVSGFATLLLALGLGYTVFRAATMALAAVLLASTFHPRTRMTLRSCVETLISTARDAIPLVSAAASVGIVIGVVTLTGIGTKLPSAILGLSQGNLPAALVLIMVSSIVIGMGLPSVVCYLLMATLVGPVLGQLGVVPLAAHLFIFYFGMMSMVTPPVALAAYAAASIAGAGIMRTGMAAFRFALVGFTLPFMFVFQPELLMLTPKGEPAGVVAILQSVLVALAGLVPFAAAIAGYGVAPLRSGHRLLLFLAAGLLLWPTTLHLAGISVFTSLGLLLTAVVAWMHRRS